MARRTIAALLAVASLSAACRRAPGAGLIDTLDGRPLAVAPFGPQQVVADLMPHDDELRGISGLAASRAHQHTLWAISDTATKLFSIRVRDDGVKVRKVDVRGVDRFDWEDLAWFEDGGVPFLLIADVGTNREQTVARRHDGAQVGQLHVLREPSPKQKKVDVLRTITFELPCEPIRDIESVAVDAVRRQVLLVEKRAADKRLLVLDLDRDHHAPTAADWTSIALPDLDPWDRQPDDLASRHLYQTSWRRNPTALDLLGDQAVLLTNRHAYVYTRAGDASWRDAFAQRPMQLQVPFTVDLPERAPRTLPAGTTPILPQREAICFAPDGDVVFVASERRDGPEAWLVRFPRR
jgi:hypothetical protein